MVKTACSLEDMILSTENLLKHHFNACDVELHVPCVARLKPFLQLMRWVTDIFGHRTVCRYAFTIACYLEKVPKVTLHKQMMAQPPWDSGQYPSLMPAPP